MATIKKGAVMKLQEIGKKLSQSLAEEGNKYFYENEDWHIVSMSDMFEDTPRSKEEYDQAFRWSLEKVFGGIVERYRYQYDTRPSFDNIKVDFNPIIPVVSVDPKITIDDDGDVHWEWDGESEKFIAWIEYDETEYLLKEREEENIVYLNDELSCFDIRDFEYIEKEVVLFVAQDEVDTLSNYYYYDKNKYDDIPNAYRVFGDYQAVPYTKNENGEKVIVPDLEKAYKKAEDAFMHEAGGVYTLEELCERLENKNNEFFGENYVQEYAGLLMDVAKNALEDTNFELPCFVGCLWLYGKCDKERCEDEGCGDECDD